MRQPDQFKDLDRDSQSRILMAHYVDGKKIEKYSVIRLRWVPCSKPEFAPEQAYRIAEPAMVGAA